MKYFFLLLSLAVFSLSVGPSEIRFSEVLSRLFSDSSEISAAMINEIIFGIRLPRTLAALSVGGALALAGLLLQNLLQNDLAEPYTLGISGGATLMLVLFSVLCKTALTSIPVENLYWVQAVVTASGALVATQAVLTLGDRHRLNSSRSLILIGLMVSLFCGSLISVLLAVMDATSLQSTMYWMMGLLGTERDQLWPAPFLALIIGGVWCFKNKRGLDALLVGDEMAQSLHPHLNQLKHKVVWICALLAATAVCTAGLIGFVGLIAPHVARRWIKGSLIGEVLLPAVWVGSALLLVADLLARSLPTESEVPAGALIAILGGPLLIYLISQKRARSPI